MLKIKTVGVLLRDKTQNYPLDQLRKVFQHVGARIILLGETTPEEKLDLVVAMGGDGTVLRALDMMPGCPVLAINYGTVGFLTAGDRDDLEQLLSRLLENDFIISDRILVRCDYEGGVVHAVNEVILRINQGMIRVDVFINEVRIRTIQGDGVIVGSPTGSTGYLLSTGAPIVMPDVSCFILDGINEYNFSSRALIVSPKSHIRLAVQPLRKNQEAYLLADGKFVAGIRSNQEINLRQSERMAQLIFFKENYFFHNLSSRLSWN